MTTVEITSKAEDHLDGLDSQARERVLKKLDEAREWTDHRLEPLTGRLTTSFGQPTTGRSSPGNARTTY